MINCSPLRTSDSDAISTQLVFSSSLPSLLSAALHGSLWESSSSLLCPFTFHLEAGKPVSNPEIKLSPAAFIIILIFTLLKYYLLLLSAGSHQSYPSAK